MRQLVFVAALLVWTWLLIKPNPVPQIVAENFLDDVKYVMGKTLHLAMYAGFAWYGCRLWPWRWVAAGLLVHAILTELGQYYGAIYFDTHRTGQVKDVVIDAVGVYLGVTTARRRSS